MTTLWFIIVVVFWAGFVVLEGFDFGVGMLHTVVGRTEDEQRLAVNSIGPFWDGNEVWLVVAGAAIFAAFPLWYATMFSTLYLAMVLLLVALIVRGVSFEFRSKVADPRWTSSWRWLLTVSSALIPLLIGVALGDLLHGLPLNKSHEYTGSFWTLLQPYGLWTGCTLVALSVLSGATFLAIKTTGDVEARAIALSSRAGVVALGFVVGLLVWTHLLVSRGNVPTLIDVAVLLAALGATWATTQRAHGWAFASTCGAAGGTIVLLFVNLYPHVMVSSTNAAYSLTAAGTVSPPYSLKVMTVVALVVMPFVLAYQAWSFWVFRRRLRLPATPDDPAPGRAPSATATSAS